jgi:hypothetical protein
MVTSLSVAWEIEAEFGELAFEFLLPGVEVGIAANGKLVDDLEYP